MEKKFGIDSYCPFFGDHKSDPCPCGWSTKKDFSDFITEFIHYSEWYQRETGGNGTSSLMEFVDWLADKVRK